MFNILSENFFSKILRTMEYFWTEFLHEELKILLYIIDVAYFNQMSFFYFNEH
mgnify:CR=1 FL=1